jgi:hypothetical protein
MEEGYDRPAMRATGPRIRSASSAAQSAITKPEGGRVETRPYGAGAGRVKGEMSIARGTRRRQRRTAFIRHVRQPTKDDPLRPSFPIAESRWAGRH